MTRFTLALALAVSAVFSMGMTSRPNASRGGAAATAALSGSTLELSAWQDVQVGSVKTNVFTMALHAAATAVQRGDVTDPGTLTVIDFSQPSTQPRMWVYDLRTR